MRIPKLSRHVAIPLAVSFGVSLVVVVFLAIAARRVTMTAPAAKHARGRSDIQAKEPQPQDLYFAEWYDDGFSQNRELDRDYHGKRVELKIEVMINTKPDEQIKEIHGSLSFSKDGRILYRTHVSEKPDVSFTDVCFVTLMIKYDDTNPDHRTLRFAKDSEIQPVFLVSAVVLADGTVKTFREATPVPK